MNILFWLCTLLGVCQGARMAAGEMKIMFVASTSYGDMDDVIVPYTSGIYEEGGDASCDCHASSDSTTWCPCSVPQRVPYLTAGRGYNLIKLVVSNQGNIHITFAQSYDLIGNKDNAALLATELNRCDADTLVILFSHEDASINRLHPELQTAMKRCKTNNILTNKDFKFDFRSSYIFLGTCSGNDENDSDSDQYNTEVYHDRQVIVQFTVKDGHFQFIEAGSGEQWFKLPQPGDPLHTWSHDCIRAGQKLLVAIPHYGMYDCSYICFFICILLYNIIIHLTKNTSS